MIRFWTFLVLASLVSLAVAQDMPPLPPLPDQPGANNSTATTAPPSAPAAPAANGAPELPPLPGDNAAASAPVSNTAPALPAPSSTEAAPVLPAPGTDQSALAAPTTETAPEETPAKPVKKAGKKRHPWQVSNYRPNVIFGGWVHAKGGNGSSRIAWASQEVLNALLFHKYRLINPLEGKAENGNYDGQPGRQWREFTFVAPKSKVQVNVYLRNSGKKVWLRVGPGEGTPPASTSLAQANKLKVADLTALHLIQKKLGHRLSPNRVVPHWDAPYRYAAASADH